MKANHNDHNAIVWKSLVVSNDSKILKWKQITTYPDQEKQPESCFQWFKDTKMKANHNSFCFFNAFSEVVSNDSKILKWKQITTARQRMKHKECCFQWFKDTKMKANHNIFYNYSTNLLVVSNDSKILKWKQITTCITIQGFQWSCFQWFKDTKMKANHSCRAHSTCRTNVVSNDSKILKWKQITTLFSGW